MKYILNKKKQKENLMMKNSYNVRWGLNSI